MPQHSTSPDQPLQSWIDSVNDPASDFPLENLPFGSVSLKGSEEPPFPAVAVGDQCVDLLALFDAGLLFGDAANDEEEDQAELFLLTPWVDPKLWRMIRARVAELLSVGNRELRDNRKARALALRPLAAVQAHIPGGFIPNYTDFYASIDHATTVGAMFRPDNPLLPNYKWVPIGYHGRASSIVPSGTPIVRPKGQTRADDNAPPVFAPCKMLDYELELAFMAGGGNDMGEAVPVARAAEHIFGVMLLNDWSARDMQKWEYQPLGPFLAKNFATTISPWIVSLDALDPFRVPALKRPEGDPRPLDYLWDESDQSRGGLDIKLEVFLSTQQMRERGVSPQRISSGDSTGLYWTPAQLFAHHTSNGCNLTPGDILASGTISGAAPGSRGCLLELTWQGTGKPRKPIELPTGEKRTFLEDGDEVIFKGFCEREGYRRIGFGECRGIVQPARP